MGDVIHGRYMDVCMQAHVQFTFSRPSNIFNLRIRTPAHTRFYYKVNIIHNIFFHSVYAFLLRWYTGNAFLINSIFWT